MRFVYMKFLILTLRRKLRNYSCQQDINIGKICAQVNTKLYISI